MKRRTILATLAVCSIGVVSYAADPPAKPYIPKPPRYSAKAEQTKLMAEGPYVFSTYDTNRKDLPAYFGRPNPNLEEEALEMDRLAAQNFGQANGEVDFWQGGADASSKVHNFEGIRAPDGLTPADNDAAVAGDWMVQTVNSSWAIYDKCGNRTHFEGYDTTVNTSKFVFDPKVVFDPWSQRWVMLIHEKDNTTSYLDVIISDDANPNGTWWYYRFNTLTTPAGGNSWSDYYELGYSANALYLAGNQFTLASNGYTSAQMVLINKTQAYAQQGVNWWRWNWYSTDSNSDRFGMRPAEMMSSSGAYDMIFTSTNRLGGTHLHVMKFADPFGAQTLSYNDINIADYTLAPNVIQPTNDVLVGFDCRVMNLMHVNDSVEGSGRHCWLGFMVQHNWGGGNVMASRFVNFNPDTNAIRLDSDWGADGLHYMFPYVVGNYRGEAAYTFGRCGPAAPNYPEIRYSAVEKSGGNWAIGASSRIHPDNPSSSYGSNRWGDYFGGSLDWGDYYEGGLSAGFQKMWFYGMYAFSSGTWGSGAGAIQIDSPISGLTVSNPNPVYYYTAGFVGTPTVSFNITTTSPVGVFVEMTSKPTWLTATTGTTGEIYDGSGRTMSFQVNANADALPFGRHVGTVVFTNCYTGGTYSRNVTLSLGQFMCPSSFTLLDGAEFGGGIADVCSRNNVYHRFLSDEVNLETDLWYTFNALIDGAEYLYWYVEAKSYRLGLTQVVYLWNSATGQWIQVDGRVAPTVDTYISGSKNPAGDFVTSSGFGYLRLQTLPINDEDPASDGWVLDVDYVQTYEYP